MNIAECGDLRKRARIATATCRQPRAAASFKGALYKGSVGGRLFVCLRSGHYQSVKTIEHIFPEGPCWKEFEAVLVGGDDGEAASMGK